MSNDDLDIFRNGLRGAFVIATVPTAIGLITGNLSLGFYAVSIGLPVFGAGYLLAMKDAFRLQELDEQARINAESEAPER